MSNATDNTSFGSGLTDFHEVRKYIVYMTYDITVFLYQ